MKSSLFFAALLLFASSAQAQHHHQYPQHGGNGPGFGINGWGGTSGGGMEYGFAAEPFATKIREVIQSSTRTNDGPFVPSTYMNYEDALALGQQQLAAAEKSRAERPRPITRRCCPRLQSRQGTDAEAPIPRSSRQFRQSPGLQFERQQLPSPLTIYSH